MLTPVRLRARLRSIRLLQPLAHRDFALLAGAAAISLLGDGFFTVALAWQVYEISNLPTALSLVGAAWTLPVVIFILLGGVLSDRYDRRWLMIGADVVRALAIGAMGMLSLSGAIELWHIIVLIAFVGLGDAFFNPASTAIVPDLLPSELLPQANALQGFFRPMAVRLIGPAIGGFVVASVGPGAAFLIDGGSFVVSMLFLAAISTRPVRSTAAASVRRTFAEIGEGLAFVRRTPWLWATLVSAMFSLLLFIGPVQVLLPFIIKNRLELDADALGLVFAVGGIGSVLAALVIGQVGLPRRTITVMYVSWAVGVALLAGYGLMTSLWQALLVGFVSAALFQVGAIIWVTLLQQLVPRHLLGRVSSMDWLVSTGLVPVSFALTGPVSEAIGPGTTLVVGGLVGAVLMGALLFYPGVRDPERMSLVAQPEPIPEAGP
jgi:hypothetical protein